MAWRERRAKELAKEPGTEYTRDPVHLQFVVDSEGKDCWGIGFRGGVVNSKAKEAILGLKGDHSQWKGWRDEFMANLR